MKKSFEELQEEFPDVVLKTELEISQGYMVYASYKGNVGFIGWYYPEMNYSWKIKNFKEACEHYMTRDEICNEVEKNFSDNGLTYSNYSMKDYLLNLICQEAMVPDEIQNVMSDEDIIEEQNNFRELAEDMLLEAQIDQGIVPVR